MFPADPHDIRFSFRTLAKNPGFTAVAVATLALGIGVNAAVFTVTNAVLFKGFPLVAGTIASCTSAKEPDCCVSYPDFEDWRAQSKSFDGNGDCPRRVEESSAIEAAFRRVYDATEVSADTFQLVGQRPILGGILRRRMRCPALLRSRS